MDPMTQMAIGLISYGLATYFAMCLLRLNNWVNTRPAPIKQSIVGMIALVIAWLRLRFNVFLPSDLNSWDMVTIQAFITAILSFGWYDLLGHKNLLVNMDRDPVLDESIR